MAKTGKKQDAVVVERVATDSLIIDPSNLRQHNERNLEAIKGSLARFGQQRPIVVGADNVVIAGNGTLIAARALGWVEIDVARSRLSGSEAVAYAIADNRTAELAEWDFGSLAATIQKLEDDLLAATGFSERDIDELIAGTSRHPAKLDIEPYDPTSDTKSVKIEGIPQNLGSEVESAIRDTMEQNGWGFKVVLY